MEAIRNKKRAKIRPKSMRKCIEKGSKSRLGGSQIGVWRGSGRLLGPRCLQDASWAPFGALWGRFWAPSRCQVGGQKGTQIEAKSSQKSIKIWMPLGMGFGADFGGSRGPRWSQVGFQIGSNIGPNIERRIFQKVWLSGRNQ